MKKYKLLQWYPSLGKRTKDKSVVATKQDNSNFYSLSIDNIFIMSVRDDEVENNPDFWELISQFCVCPIPIRTKDGLRCLKCEKDFEEKKEPLFTTDDGVEVFDDTTETFAVDRRTLVKQPCEAYRGNYEHYLYFFHESNADEYIWKNKPVFSYEDFIKWGNVPYQRVIEQLAKERSKQNE